MKHGSFTSIDLKTALDEAVDHAQAHAASQLPHTNRVKVSFLSMTLSLKKSAANRFELVERGHVETHHAKYTYIDQDLSNLQITLLDQEPINGRF